MKQAYFYIPENIPPVKGITFGDRWNGWECPYFTIEGVKQILAYTGEGHDMDYDDGTYYSFDEGQVFQEDVEDGDVTKTVVDPKNVGGVNYYPIGGWYWVWQQYSEKLEHWNIETLHKYAGKPVELSIDDSKDREGNQFWTINIVVDNSIEDSITLYDQDEAEDKAREAEEIFPNVTFNN
jgi:hypothetical protein